LSFARLIPGSEKFADSLESEAAILDGVEPKMDLILGKLSIKLEAAGKARVFAITDALTQSVMKPLSDAIFKLLRTLPMDGTFNQSAPLDRLVQLAKNGEIPEQDRVFYSYDLSSATDRLPMQIQKDILGLYFGESFSEL